jgi:hypothetical protein
MKTTLNEIKKYKLYQEGWEKLLKSLNKTTADDEELTIEHILNSNGIDDALWVITVLWRSSHLEDYCNMLADIVESIAYHSSDKRVGDCIQAIRDYGAGKISKKELGVATDAARATARAAARAVAAAYAAASAYDAYADADAYAAEHQKQKTIILKYFGEK